MTKSNCLPRGYTKSRAYKAWKNMKLRCKNPKAKGYKRYGGRGIKVCDRWQSFENFFADMGECPDTYEIDRINNEGDYIPTNCRWVSRKENSRNKPGFNHHLTFKGITKNLIEWAEQYNLKYVTLRARILRGWSVEDALTFPIAPGKYYRDRIVRVKVEEIKDNG